MFEKLIWKIKFKAELKKQLGISGKELVDCADAESDNYFDDAELWREYTPVEAVSENLSYWGD